jgi:hypothetical protein
MNKILIAFTVVMLNSCSWLYGVREQKLFNKDKALKSIQRNLPEDANFFYSDKAYFDFIKSKFLDESYKKFFLQPLQAHYFKNDTLISSHVNCNVGGFPKLNWNYRKNFDVFPPNSQFQIKDSVFLFSELKEYLFPLQVNSVDNAAPYRVLIFGNLYLEKQTKHLLKQIMKNVEKSERKISIIFVNNDMWFID